MNFCLSFDQLLDIARQMRHDLKAGLSAESEALLCIPTYLPGIWPPPAGRALAIDIGGTNARCAVVSLSRNQRLMIETGPVKREIPLHRGVSMSRETFSAFLNRLIRRLDPPPGLPVGFCFSYPARPTPDGDAVILNWTKELFVEDTIGRKAGEILLEYLKKNEPGLMVEAVFVINDTVASLLAGMATSQADLHIGLIAGTGTNMAILIPSERAPKIKDDVRLNSLIPVNLESGNFHPPHLTEIDTALDASSSDPSHHRFEKAVSGMYLPYLFKRACPESRLDPADGSGPLFELAYSATIPDTKSQSATEAFTARQIVERSAAMIAGALAGVVVFLSEPHENPSVYVTAEGGLFHAHPRYREIVSSTLQRLLQGLGRDDITFEIGSVANANLLGCAIAGLTPEMARQTS